MMAEEKLGIVIYKATSFLCFLEKLDRKVIG